MKPIPVLQVLDSLDLGGYERAAVNLANALPRERFESWICAARRGGPLEASVAPHVGVLKLGRRGRLDAGAVRRLAGFVRARGVRILHPHGPSLFLARAAALAAPGPALVWHVHFGRYAAEDRRAWHYRLAAHGLHAAIGVNGPLVEWMRRRLRVPASRSWYVPNLAADPGGGAPAADLPGSAGLRIVCAGNLRPEKDHLTLVRAMAVVVREVPDAHVLLAGAPSDPDCAAKVKQAVESLGLARSVTLLGLRQDIGAVLAACDIGVLSSRFEGLPMALLEYGKAGLPAVATSAGQCPEVLDEGRAGILVPPGDDAALARALVALLRSQALRASLAERLAARVESVYGPRAVLRQICAIYDTVLGRPLVEPCVSASQS